MNARSRRSRRGMTLIEVVVVVAILLFVMSVLSLSMFSTFSSSAVGTARLREAREAERREIEQLRHPAPPPVAAARITSAVVDVAVDAEPVAEWPWVSTLADVQLVARYVVTPGIGDPTDVVLAFPLPLGARGVGLSVVEGPDVHTEPTYGRDRVEWLVSLDRGASMTVELVYRAPAVDRWVWHPPSVEAQPVDLDVTVALPPGYPMAVGPGSLAPTSRDGDVLRWQLQDVVAPAPIGVELPADGTPLGRIARVCWLSAAGLFAFCAGFWFLAEGERPGHLDDFRLGGLLLLALNYTSFYVTFAVLGLRIGAWALPIAAVTSLPLLTLHVARLTHRRFAVGRVLPLAAATMTAVLAFVYFEPWRPLVVLGAGVAATAGVTVSFRSWSEGRRAWVAVTDGQRIRAARLGQLERAFDGLRATIEQRASQATAAARTLADLPSGLGAERAAAGRTLARLERALVRARGLVVVPQDWAMLGERPHQASCAARAADVARAEDGLGQLGTALAGSLDRLEAAAARAVDELSAGLGELERAVDTLIPVEVGARSAATGAPARLRREVDPALERVGEVRAAAAALIDRVGRPDGDDLRTLGVTAVRLAHEADVLAEQLRTATGPLGEAMRRTDPTEEARVHCPTCGCAHAEGSRYCSGCGTMRPAELACAACGRVSRLPRHLLRHGWARETVHCGGCGVQAALGL